MESAIREGNLERIKKLVENGENFNLKNERGSAPLHIAVTLRKINIIEYLLKIGANIDIRDLYEQTPLHKAASNRDNMAVIKYLVMAGAYVNAVDIDGKTPLHITSIYEQLEASRYLINHGADIHAKDQKGISILMDAICFSENLEIIKILLELGVDVNAQDVNGNSAPFDMSRIDIARQEGVFINSIKMMIQYEVLYNPRATKPGYINSDESLSLWWDKCLKQALGIRDARGPTDFVAWSTSTFLELPSRPASVSLLSQCGNPITHPLPRLPSTFHIGFTTEPVKVDRITEDSSKQRMTEVRDDYFADALTNMQHHCEDLISCLKDAMRGLAAPCIEKVIIAPINISGARNIFLHQLEQAGKIHREILALPRQPASTMSQGNHRKKVVNGIGKKREAESNGQKFQVDRPRPVRTPATVSKVKRLATTENPPSQRQLSRMCGTSLKTINNIIHKDLELDTRRKGKVHKLTPFHMKNRATNARKLYEEHLAGSRSEYTATLDEAWMYVTYCNGIRKICYIKRGNQVPDNWVHQCSETFPKGSIEGEGELRILYRMRSETCHRTTEGPLPRGNGQSVPSSRQSLSHTSNKTQQFLQEMKDTLGLNFIRNSDIPVKSPDASPLDFYGFGMLKQRLFNRRPKTEAGLWKAAQEEWSNVSLSKVKEVFAAWKVRCREIAKKKGKHIEHM
ncbi:MTPN [Cordylochernes scorpioides]|uniref:MTPN n=1 Tax=Cordylochernes scorpioides TaxID=51811 RepID=A0ABY6L4P4_9ARAC|nr:MTPN [Cordylochernes scorpioides]